MGNFEEKPCKEEYTGLEKEREHLCLKPLGNEKAIRKGLRFSGVWAGKVAKVQSAHCSCQRPEFISQHPCWAVQRFL